MTCAGTGPARAGEEHMKRQNPGPAEAPAVKDRITNRRGFIAGAAGVAGLFALGAAARGETPPLVRPPGSADEARMKSLCLRCDRCRSACHTGAIGVGGLSEGLLVMRTPVMNFHNGFCDFCRRCADVCPTGAISDFDPETARIGLAHVTESCIALRTAACTACEEACPEDAITLDAQNRPVVDPDICNGCGKCEQICPANVYQAYRGGDLRGIIVRPLSAGRQGEAEGDAKGGQS